MVEITDFSTLIADELMLAITDETEQIQLDAIQMAEAEAKGYLRRRFDVDTVFAQTGDDRNKALLMTVIDMVVYHIYARVNPRAISEIRAERYENAKKTLSMLDSGKIDFELPLKPADEQTSSSIWGYKPKPTLSW